MDDDVGLQWIPEYPQSEKLRQYVRNMDNVELQEAYEHVHDISWIRENHFSKALTYRDFTLLENMFGLNETKLHHLEALLWGTIRSEHDDVRRVAFRQPVNMFEYYPEDDVFDPSYLLLLENARRSLPTMIVRPLTFNDSEPISHDPYVPGKDYYMVNGHNASIYEYKGLRDSIRQYGIDPMTREVPQRIQKVRFQLPTYTDSQNARATLLASNLASKIRLEQRRRSVSGGARYAKWIRRRSPRSPRS